jgi:hypothetical protein
VTLSSPITHPDTRESHEDGRIVLEFNHEDQIHIVERELSAPIGAVTQLFGPEEAKLSVEDWLDELELVDSTSLDKSRLAGGFGCSFRDIGKAANGRTASTNIAGRTGRTKVWPIPSSNCFASALLM